MCSMSLVRSAQWIGSSKKGADLSENSSLFGQVAYSLLDAIRPMNPQPSFRWLASEADT